MDTAGIAADAIEGAIGGINRLFGDDSSGTQTNDYLEQIEKKMNEGADDVHKIRGAVSRHEDLRWLKELAEREFVNNVNVRTLTPTINITTNNANLKERDVAKIMAKELSRMQAAGAQGAYGEY